LWGNFPESEGSTSIEKARFASVATVFREKGKLTTEAAQVVVDVASRWAAIKITLQKAQNWPRFGAHDFNILHVPGVTEFDIESSAGLVSAPSLASRDPACSNSLLRAIAGGAALLNWEFPPTVFPELNADISLPLPQSAKPEALILAHSIWARVSTNVPETALGDHTEQDSMGTTNLGTVFKLCSLMLAQGTLCKYIV
jgi:hypothetical protein